MFTSLKDINEKIPVNKNMTSIEKYNWYKEHEKEIETFFKEGFEEWFEEYINKLPNIKDVKKD